MFRRFLDGFVFGGGFAIAFFVIQYAGFELFVGWNAPSEMYEVSSDKGDSFEQEGNRKTVKFHELTDEDRIRNASVIAITRYKPSKHGKVAAVISEIYKKDPGTKFFFEVGDEFHDASYYPEEGVSYGEGMVILFSGSPAEMKQMSSFDNGRVRGMRGMPMELLIKIYTEPNT